MAGKLQIIDKFAIEKELWESGYSLVCGVDEVGRGPLAGPVVCAAVIMPRENPIDGVDDSKKLSAKKREYLSEKIKESAIAYAICRVEPQKIDEINILQATKLCMKNAVESLSTVPDFAIVDGNMKMELPVPYKSIVKADLKSYTVGAASIIAKVYRDNLMCEYAKEYPQYGFDKNVGYGTAEHIAAIKAFGLCPIHRRSFTGKWQ